MNANSHYRKRAKCTKCTEAEQHTQVAEAQSREHVLRSEMAEVAARDANSRAERLALELGGATQRAEEFRRRAVEAKKRVGDWRIFGSSALRVERLHSPRALVQSEGSNHYGGPARKEARISLLRGRRAHFPDVVTKK